jgi:hypothetical protein
MTDYNFLVLSPNEFENISRDLLQKKLSVFIESFTTGRDGGIDLRYSIDKDKQIIIQSKRFKTFTSLLSHLKKEVSKVNYLKPGRYILTTSVGLSPMNKSQIMDLFSPYIKSTEDILGKNDLNNLINLNPDIERQYYKLWLSSTNILEKVLHSKVYNQSAFELEEIKDQIKLYVQNESFDRALKILKNHKYLIISGIPGIGKTTLARVIVLYLLSDDFEEFIFLNQSIDDGYELFNVEKKQVFLFDDFLGKNFLENKLLPNEDNKIIKFIETIKKTPNKLIIFTTREYILNQAKNASEVFNIKNIDLAKCVLDISSYTNIIKAQILYNHLFFADVPVSHINNLIEYKAYVKLIKHPNYNPRIIEAIVSRRIWENCSPSQFSEALIQFFDNPESVWLYAYENTINKFSQYSLLVLLTMETPVLLEDWENGVREFCHVNSYKYIIHFDSITFNKTIKELENTFIRTQKDSKKNFVVQYQNPSIQDFLVNYLKEKNDLIESLLKSSIYSEQLFRIFTTSQEQRKVYLNKPLLKIALERVVKEYSSFKSTQIYRLKLSNKSIVYSREMDFEYEFLNNIFGYYQINPTKKLLNFIIDKFQNKIYIKSDKYIEQSSYLKLLNKLDLSSLQFDKSLLIKHFIQSVSWLDRFDLVADLKGLFPEEYENVVKSSFFIEKVKEVVSFEMDNLKDADIYELKQNIEGFIDNFNFDFKEELDMIDTLERERENYVDHQMENYKEERRFERDHESTFSEDKIIDEIFNSLKDS